MVATTTQKPKKRMARRFNKLGLSSSANSRAGIIYLGHLPKGLEEPELRKYFD